MTSRRGIDLLPKLNSAFSDSNWEELSKLINPKEFATAENGDLIAYQVLAKIACILIKESSVSTIPDNIKIACLKCLGNSCFNGYKYKEHKDDNDESDKYCNDLYSKLSTDNESDRENLEENSSYSYTTQFPYKGIVQWTCDYIVSCDLSNELSVDEVDILRLTIQFLCNFFTFTCKDSNCSGKSDIPNCLCTPKLKTSILNCTQSEHLYLVRASSIFIHNALKELPNDYFTFIEKVNLCKLLIKPLAMGFESAKVSLLCLVNCPGILSDAYEKMSMDDKLYLLEVIYNEVSESAYEAESENSIEVFSKDAIEFLCERFRHKSDLILKTADSYLENVDPIEIVILLDILGALTSKTAGESNFIKTDKSLLINCIYLLKSIQMIGKQSDNVFTPMQKLSDVAPAAHGLTVQEQLNATPSSEKPREKIVDKNDPESHPAFGFKAGLIRLIGNMSYKNKTCQNLIRELDAIPLLLDCCNIDARNPLIIQWTIFALRNLCENNQENQEIIHNCTKIGTVENSVLKDMGLTLHEDEDGKKIGIMPLVRKE